MLCGCFASSGTGNLQCVEGEMNLLRYQEIFSVEAEAWASLDLPTGSQAYLKFHQGLVAEVLEDSTVTWWDLKKVVTTCKPKNITEL